MPKRCSSPHSSVITKKSRNMQSGTKAAAHCIIQFGSEILIVRAKRKQVWQPVGGKIEGSETTEECILREVKEETGLNLTEAKFQLCLEPTYLETMKSDIFFCTVLAKPATKPGNEIAECRWVPIDDVGVNCDFCLQRCLTLRLVSQGTTSKTIAPYYIPGPFESRMSSWSSGLCG